MGKRKKQGSDWGRTIELEDMKPADDDTVSSVSDDDDDDDDDEAGPSKKKAKKSSERECKAPRTKPSN